MKFKHVVASLSLAMFAAFGAAAGLSMKKEVKAVKADELDTWMMHFSLKSGDIAGYMDSDSMWVQTYTEGVGNAKWFQMYPIESGSEFLAVNATFPESYSFNRIQYKFSQGGVEKWGTPYSTSASKESHSKMLYSTFSGSWSGDNWNFSVSTYPDIYASYKDVKCYLVEDPANKRFIGSNLVSDESDNYTFLYRGSWAFAEVTLTESSKEYFSYLTTEWCSMNAGTYDVILKNNNDDGGIVEIKKHESPSESFIYYVTASDSATTDYIYSWGGSEQFGAFPGKSIASLVAEDEAEEVTGNGVLHFQGSETPKLIYRINIAKGYPVGDTMFMFNNGTSDYKSAEREIVLDQAYWWTGDANMNAAQGINFLVTLESYRNGVTDYSVCNISESNAQFLIGLYNAYDDDVLETYINSSSVYTWADKEKSGNALISVEKIVEQLGKIAGVAPKGSSLFFGQYDLVSNNTMIIVITIAATSALAFTLLLVFKKKRQK